MSLVTIPEALWSEVYGDVWETNDSYWIPEDGGPCYGLYTSVYTVVRLSSTETPDLAPLIATRRVVVNFISSYNALYSCHWETGIGVAKFGVSIRYIQGGITYNDAFLVPATTTVDINIQDGIPSISSDAVILRIHITGDNRISSYPADDTPFFSPVLSVQVEQPDVITNFWTNKVRTSEVI